MSEHQKDLRLHFPLWLGGNNPLYQFGADLLAWLAPETDAPVVRVPVAAVTESFTIENGIRARSEVLKELDAAAEIIRQHAPDRITVLGGDCLIDLAPFAWLRERWGEGLGILWIDTHPDVMTPAQYENAHAHVLGALLGSGDADLTQRVAQPVSASKVLIAGIHSPNAYEAQFIRDHAIRTLSPEQLAQQSGQIRQWIEQENISHLAIHFDLDVLDYHQFRSLLFARPDGDAHAWDGTAKGKLTMADVLSLVKEAESAAQVVGLGVAEHLPWDAFNLKNLLAELPLLRKA